MAEFDRKNNARIGLTLDPTLAARFTALAEFDRKKPATLAVEIIRAYMETRNGDIEKVLAARAEYENTVEKIRKAKTAD